jgi:nucleotide-binding universal stress UspA family protein
MSVASIVAGTDGSPSAQCAVEKAGELAAALDATVHVVTSYAAPTASWMAAAGGVAADESALENAARSHAEEIVSRTQLGLSACGIRARPHVCCGDPADALIAISDGEGAKMIVVGNRGMNGASRVLGSLPNRVSHRANCCVLIVPTVQAVNQSIAETESERERSE